MAADEATQRWRRHALSAVIIVAMVIAAVVFRPDLALRVGVGVTAHDICTGVFVDGQDPDTVFNETLAPRPGYQLIARFVHYEVAKDKGVVQAWIGGVRRRAVYTPGRGCLLLINGGQPLKPFAPEPAALSAAPSIGPPTVVAPSDPALIAALDRLFQEEDIAHPRRVKAVVVLHKGKIIAERYGPGYGLDTPIHGWSVSKSVMNALVGILVRDGKLHVDERDLIPGWSRPGDRRQAITVEQLMRMTSGLDIDEDNSGFDPSSRIIYTQRNMAQAAAMRPLKRAPGAEFHYGSPSTVLLSKIVQMRVGGTPQAFQRFARQELFEPLGMSRVTVETDAEGTAVMSAYISAPARSWARFGQLYLDDGRVGQMRLLPPGWAAFSARPTLNGNYGAGFWTNGGSAEEARERVAAGFPRDGYYASGALGQRIYIIPSRQVVIARFGFSAADGFGVEQDLAFIRSVLANLPKDG